MAALGVLIVLAAIGATSIGTTSRPSQGIPQLQDAIAINEPAAEGMRHPVSVRRPAGPPRIATGQSDLRGEPVTVACGTCHGTTKPNLETRSGEQLKDFHQGMSYAHGNLTCLSCHNATDYDTLRLADGSSVSFPDVMTLCGQCHGPQLRDYHRGLHGGMNGYWDLTRGPRTRNNCINCHDPHAPQFPLVQPVFPPRDRISVRPKETKNHPAVPHPQ